MKKISLLIVISITTLACSSSDNEPEDIWFYFKTFSQLSSDSEPKRINSKILLLPADNGETYKTETRPVDGYTSNWIDEDIANAFKTGKALTVSGEEIQCVYQVEDDGYTLSPGVIVEPGRYFLLVGAVGGLLTSQHWTFSNKYTGKYIEIKESTQEEKTFFGDSKNAGFQQWDVPSSWEWL